MQISQSKRKLPFFIFIFLLLPSLSWGDCFGPKITALANTSKPVKAKLISNKKLGADRCQLTLLISGTRLTGEAQSKLCSAKKNDIVSVKIKTQCCDTQPCKKGQQNKILFSPWVPSLKTLLPSLDSSKKSKTKAIETAKPKPTTTGQPMAENGVVKNTINIAPAENVAIGKGTTDTKSITDSGIAGTTGIAMSNGGAGQTQNTTLAATSAEDDFNALLETSPPAAGSAESTQNKLDKYKVELGVDEKIVKPGPPAQLTVWIGDPTLSAGFSEDMATAETTIAAVAPFAKVTPNAPDFEVEPKESICMKVDPSGSEVFFAITPKHTGTFKVGASVLLYHSDKCDGAPVPKSAADLEVKVKVNPKGIAKNFFLEMADIARKAALNFWTWLVATVFGLFVFLIRKKLKKWFGFDAPDAGSSGN